MSDAVTKKDLDNLESRIDKKLEERMVEIKHKAGMQEEVKNLMGKASIANARIVYAKYLDFFHGPQFVKLKKQGARPQRLLWASTSVKNKAYGEFKYVKSLIAKNTVNTLPPATPEVISVFASPTLI